MMTNHRNNWNFSVIELFCVFECISIRWFNQNTLYAEISLELRHKTLFIYINNLSLIILVTFKPPKPYRPHQRRHLEPCLHLSKKKRFINYQTIYFREGVLNLQGVYKFGSRRAPDTEPTHFRLIAPGPRPP